MTSKAQRQQRIARLIGARPIGTQADLVALLAAEGVVATQTTVSRDLEELGALKVRLPGGDTAYALPEGSAAAPAAPEDHLRRVLGEWVGEIASSGPVVVLRTPPGSAHVVGSAIDRSALPGIVGTVAGDDTVIVIAAEAVGGRRMADRLRTLAGLPAPAGTSSSGAGVRPRSAGRAGAGGSAGRSGGR